jgi:hypothetical protein
MIPSGHWHPDAQAINGPLMLEAVNVLPTVQGFRPLRSPVAVSEALPGDCRGAATVVKTDGSGRSYAGTQTGLYTLAANVSWTDITRASGGAYATGAGERWRFSSFGDNILATNFADDPQKASIASGGAFEALGGSPPRARYIDIMRDFVVLACINGNESRLHWSAINDAEGWTVGTGSSDTQDMPTGGPIQGFIGGEVGYVMQRTRVTRMNYLPGNELIMQFDEVEGGRGLVAPNSLVRLGQEAFYLSSDGFYRMDLAGGGARPIGIGKWQRWFLNDLKSGTQTFVLGAVSPQNSALLWPYVSKSNPSTTLPDKVLIYDWSIDEAAIAEFSVQALASWLTAGVSLDGMNSYGTLDELPVSLDSSFWKGGAPLVGIINGDNKLAHLEGVNLAARFVTGDGQRPNRRTLVEGTRVDIDTSSITVEVAARERDSDTVVYGPAEAMEDTGIVPAWESGNLVRARVTVQTGATWTYAKGISTVAADAGSR